MLNYRLVTTILIMLLFSCKSSKTEVEKGEVMMTFERTPCFGACPVYQATLYKSGKLVFEGKKFTDKEGCFQARISKKELEALYQQFEESGFAELANEYPEKDKAPVDLPSCKITYQFKTVVDRNWGAPEKLTSLQLYIDTLIYHQKLKPCH